MTSIGRTPSSSDFPSSESTPFQTWEEFPEYHNVFGPLQVGLNLDQFSKQRTSVRDWNDNQLKTRLGLDTYPNACEMVEFFGARKFGMVVEYQGKHGYSPERTRQYAKSYCCPLDFEGPRSVLLGAHSMGEYGSGGFPEFVLEDLKSNRTNSALSLEMSARKYVNSDHDDFTQPFLETVQECKDRSVNFGKLAYCRAAISIQMCWSVSTTLGQAWGNWLLKVAVHAACTLQRAKTGELESRLAAITLFQLSHEIRYGLQHLLLDFRASTEKAAITAMLIEAGRGFISAGLCQLSTEELPEKYACFLFGVAMITKSSLTVANAVVFKLTEWKELATRCIKSTNFCPSRQRFSMTLDLNQREMFHLIARAEHFKTSRSLHSTCGDTCVKASSTTNHKQAGHMDEGCDCATKDFMPIETSQLVLFDTVNQELLMAKPGYHCYVAVSQIWFQGIFGQSSRKCGGCSLDYLATACRNIGVRYAWIDTLCMPTRMELRREVIGQLRSIYLNAGATLVVDAGLKSTTVRTALDLSLAVLLSDWSSRVWTLQEGVLASKLLFCVGEKVLALPQMDASLELLDQHQTIPGTVLEGYGDRAPRLETAADGQFALNYLLRLAAGRQTSYPCDYLYGLSALLPTTPTNRDQDPEQVAIEVARMYKRPMGFFLGILMTSYERCKTEGYRWMPMGAKNMRGYDSTRSTGLLAKGPGGLECPDVTLIKLTSIANIYGEVKDSSLWVPTATVMMDKMGFMYWYSTEMTGVFVSSSVKADNLVFCLVDDLHEDISVGFVVSPTTYHGRPAYQYIGVALLVGEVPANPSNILVT